MCGLFGFSGDPKTMTVTMARMVTTKVKILGIYNIDRGKHSCGLYLNNQIFKGVNDDKLFNDFIQNNELPNITESGNYTVIGHTRQATHGSHIASNAHPFVIDENFVLAHNGVIKNIWSLCSKYGIKCGNIHVDSEGLAHLINKEGFKILNEYEGFAALLMARSTEPNSLYIYRGSSKRTEDGEEEEERPLFYMQSPEGIYVSSIEKSLLAISDDPSDRIKIVEANIVHKITNGKMTKSKFPISRGSINISKPITTYYSGGTVSHHPTHGAGTGTMKTETDGTSSTNSRIGNIFTSSSSTKSETKLPIIWFETYPNRIDRYKHGNGSRGIIYHRGRYWIVDAEEISLAHGAYYINRKGHVSISKSRNNQNYFFLEGILMKSEKHYSEAIVDNDLKDKNVNFAVYASKYSEYPVGNTCSDLTSRCFNLRDEYKHKWFYNTDMCGNYGFTPKWSDRNYRILAGELYSIASNKRDEYGNCIDTNAMTVVKNEKKEASIADSSTENGKTQQTLFRTSKNEKEERVLSECDLANFYKIFDSVPLAKKELTTIELNAIRYYVSDIMRAEMQVDTRTIHDIRIEMQVNMMLQVCVDQQKYIIDEWDEKNYNDILHYLLIATENPKGEIYADTVSDSSSYEDDPVKDDSCCYIPVKPIEKQIHTITDEEYEEYVKKSYENVETGNPDTEPPMIEIAAAAEREQAQVPLSTERWMSPVDEEDKDLFDKPVESNEDIHYNITDVVDYLVDSRSCADMLQTFQESDFAQACAGEIYKSVDPLLYKLLEVAEKSGEEKIIEHIVTSAKGLIKS